MTTKLIISLLLIIVASSSTAPTILAQQSQTIDGKEIPFRPPRNDEGDHHPRIPARSPIL